MHGRKPLPDEIESNFKDEIPEDLLKKVENNEKWLEMSEACKVWYVENCSVDGIWQLTKKLCSL